MGVEKKKRVKKVDVKKGEGQMPTRMKGPKETEGRQLKGKHKTKKGRLLLLLLWLFAALLKDVREKC
jgi:hypothetical protein